MEHPTADVDVVDVMTPGCPRERNKHRRLIRWVIHFRVIVGGFSERLTVYNNLMVTISWVYPITRAQWMMMGAWLQADISDNM